MSISVIVRRPPTKKFNKINVTKSMPNQSQAYFATLSSIITILDRTRQEAVYAYARTFLTMTALTMMSTICLLTSTRSSANASTMDDFTFWISLSLSLFAQSKIQTERKLNQKVKSIFLFGLSPKDWAKRQLIRLVWSSDSVQMNLHATDRLIPYILTFAERKTTSLFRLVQTNRIAKKSTQRNNY